MKLTTHFFLLLWQNGIIVAHGLLVLRLPSLVGFFHFLGSEGILLLLRVGKRLPLLRGLAQEALAQVLGLPGTQVLDEQDVRAHGLWGRGLICLWLLRSVGLFVIALI